MIDTKVVPKHAFVSIPLSQDFIIISKSEDYDKIFRNMCKEVNGVLNPLKGKFDAIDEKTILCAIIYEFSDNYIIEFNRFAGCAFKFRKMFLLCCKHAALNQEEEKILYQKITDIDKKIKVWNEIKI